MGYINKEALEKGHYYECKARGFRLGMWDGEKFLYIRNKYGKYFLDTAKHWDEGAPYGTVKPLKKYY